MNDKKSSRIQFSKTTEASNLALRHIENRIEELTQLVIKYINRIVELQIILVRERDIMASTKKSISAEKKSNRKSIRVEKKNN